MKIVEDLVERTLSSMTADERRDLILRVVERMLAQMKSSERVSLMEHVVDRFMDGLPPGERQAPARELVPRLLGQLLKSGDMSVDELLWAAMGSLGALEKAEGESAVSGASTPPAGPLPGVPHGISTDAVQGFGPPQSQ